MVIRNQCNLCGCSIGEGYSICNKCANKIDKAVEVGASDVLIYDKELRRKGKEW